MTRHALAVGVLQLLESIVMQGEKVDYSNAGQFDLTRFQESSHPLSVYGGLARDLLRMGLRDLRGKNILLECGDSILNGLEPFLRKGINLASEVIFVRLPLGSLVGMGGWVAALPSTMRQWCQRTFICQRNDTKHGTLPFPIRVSSH